MYLPRHFAEVDHEAIVGLVRKAGFGHLVIAGGDGLDATPVPFVVDDDLTSVRAHLARPNPIWRAAPCESLLIVPVSDAYISPTWYPSKAEHGRVVPTWNYEVVHLRGRLVAHDDDAWIDDQIRELTDRNEARLDPPWSVDDAPVDHITGLRRAIVGIELEVGSVEAKRKLSQNKSADDIAGAIAGLRAIDGGERVAAAMHAARSERAEHDA